MTLRNTMREAAAAEPRFDLAVSNAPAQQVFLQIVTGTRYSMLVAPEVAGTVAVNLKNVTVRAALDALRDLYGCEYTMTGGRMHIQPNTLQTRIFQVNYLAGKRHGTSSMRVTSSSIAGSGAYLRLTQVMIDATIIEVQISKSYGSGLNWAALRGSNGRF